MKKKIKPTVLQNPDEIRDVLRLNSKRTSHLGFYVKIKETYSLSRLGLAIPKKQARRAVDRNRLKRIIREEFRKAQRDIPIDIVVKLNTPIGKRTRNKLRESERKYIRNQVIQFFEKKE